jgi:hypothetical protein
MAILKRSQTVISGLPEDLATLRSGAGLTAEIKDVNGNITQIGGQYVQDANSVHIAEATSLSNADKLLNDALVAEAAARSADKTALDAAIAAETAAREASHITLNTIINGEISDRIADVIDESNQRTAADAALQTAITAEQARAEGVESTLQTAITQEVNDRTAADTALQTAITAEQTRAEGVESNLQTAINANAAAITQEVNDRTTAIGQEVLDRNNAIASAISAAEANLGTTHTVSTEADRDALTSDDLDLNDNVFVQDMNGDGSLGDWAVFKVVDTSTTPITFRKIMDGETYAAAQELDLEDHKRIDRIDNGDYLGAGTGTTLDTTSQFVIPAINELHGEVDTNTASISTLSTSLATETARATSAEQANAAAINSEASTREAADTALQTAINDEIANRTAADTALQTAIDAEATARATAIANEASAREAADTALQTAIDAEVASREAADTALQTAIDAVLAVGTTKFITEKPVVDTSSKIVLTHKPKNGVVLNFATVRFVDANGQAFDATVIEDVTDSAGKTFIVETGGEDWESKAVTIQYAYVPQ